MLRLKKHTKSPRSETFDKTVPADLFGTGYSTTYQNDFKKYTNAVRTGYPYEQKRKEDPDKIVSRPYEREDHETYAKYRKGAQIPIELYVPPKPIIRTNPHQPFEALGKLPETPKEEAIKTRPRVYMVPAIPMDNIKESDERKLLCYHMYTTQGRKVEKEATAYFKPIKPRIDKIETTDTVSLKFNFVAPLAEKFRKAGREWDNDQLRGDPDPTKEFWINKDPPVVCGACVDPLKNIVPEDVKKTLRGLVKEEKLTLAHDMKPVITYTGFKPKLPAGIALEKKKLSTLHPLLSVSQVFSNRTPEEVAELANIHDSEHSNVSYCDLEN